MTARIIDGKAVARKLRAEYAVRVERLKSRARRAAGHRRDPGWRQPGLPGLRPQQDQGLRGDRHPLRAAPACRPRRRSRSCWRASTAQCRSEGPRHPGAAAAAAAYRRRRRCWSASRWTRTSTASTSTTSVAWSPATPCSRPARPMACRSCWSTRRSPIAGPQRGGGRRQQHRRQADGADADAAGRHGLHLPQEDARPGPVHACWPTSWWWRPACRG